MTERATCDAGGFDAIYADLGLYRTHLEWIRHQPALANLPEGVLERIARYREGLGKGRIIEWMEAADGQRILDNGCGVGYFIFDIMAAFPRMNFAFAGIDISASGLGLLARRCEIEGKHNVIGAVGDIGNLPYADGTFDRVICSEVLDHTPDCAAALREMGRVLKPGGLLLVTVPNGRAMRFWQGLRALPGRLVGRRRGGEGYFEARLSVGEVRRGLEGGGFEIVHEELNTALPLAAMVRIWPRAVQPMVTRTLLAMEPWIRCELLAMNYVFSARRVN